VDDCPPVSILPEIDARLVLEYFHASAEHDNLRSKVKEECLLLPLFILFFFLMKNELCDSTEAGTSVVPRRPEVWFGGAGELMDRLIT